MKRLLRIVVAALAIASPAAAQVTIVPAPYISGAGVLRGPIAFPLGTTIAEDAANTVACRNGTNACTVKIFTAYTDSTHGEWLTIRGNAADAFQIMTDKGSAGGTTRSLYLGTGGVNRWSIDAGGNFYAITDGVGDVGASGNNRPNNVYVKTLLTVPTLSFGSALGNITGAANGKFSFLTQAQTAGVLFDVTSDASLILRNRADSGYANVTANDLIANNSFQLVGGASFLLSNKVWVRTAPIIASGFGTSPSFAITNGTASFEIIVGTGGTDSTGALTMPAVANGWNCMASDMTTPGVNATKQTAGSTNSVTLTNYNTTTGVAAAWTAGDHIKVLCGAN